MKLSIPGRLARHCRGLGYGRSRLCMPSPARLSRGTSAGPVVAVGAENEYADVISQIGGPYVRVSAIMSNPNTDPHEFEASASVAEVVSRAQLIVQNGVGYDTFMNKIESASSLRGRDVIVAQQLLGFSSNIFNPHLWYDPRTMPLVAKAVATDLSKLEPAHAGYFQANDSHFVRSLQPWLAAVASFKSSTRAPRSPSPSRWRTTCSRRQEPTS